MRTAPGDTVCDPEAARSHEEAAEGGSDTGAKQESRNGMNEQIDGYWGKRNCEPFFAALNWLYVFVIFFLAAKQL